MQTPSPVWFWWANQRVVSDVGLPLRRAEPRPTSAEADVSVYRGDAARQIAWATDPRTDIRSGTRLGRLHDGALAAQFDLRGQPWLRIDADRSHVTLQGPFHDYLALSVVNLAMPLLASEQERMVFHAAAVRFGPVAHVIVAHSGVGKSTFAARSKQRGAEVLSDDCTVIDQDGGHRTVVGSQAPIRLNPDSASLLGIAGGPADVTGKVPVGGKAGPAIPIRLGGIFELAPGDQKSEPNIEELSAPRQVKLLDEHSMSAGTYSRIARSCQVTKLVTLSADHPLRQLTYHRSVHGVDAAIDLLARW